MKSPAGASGRVHARRKVGMYLLGDALCDLLFTCQALGLAVWPAAGGASANGLGASQAPALYERKRASEADSADAAAAVPGVLRVL